MARHTKSHYKLPGVEYDPADGVLYIDLERASLGEGNKVDGEVGMAVSVQLFRDWMKLMPECRPYRVTIRGMRK